MIISVSSLPAASSQLLELWVIVGGEERLLSLVRHFENHIQQEWFEPWDQFNWLLNNMWASAFIFCINYSPVI